MKLKLGVSVLGMSPQIVLAAVVVESVYTRHSCEAVITSCTDGQHKPKSKHYTGNAIDLRTRNIDPAVLLKIVGELQAALPGYDVVPEADHIHLEWDPLGKAP